MTTIMISKIIFAFLLSVPLFNCRPQGVTYCGLPCFATSSCTIPTQVTSTFVYPCQHQRCLRHEQPCQPPCVPSCPPPSQPYVPSCPPPSPPPYVPSCPTPSPPPCVPPSPPPCPPPSPPPCAPSCPPQCPPLNFVPYPSPSSPPCPVYPRSYPGGIPSVGDSTYRFPEYPCPNDESFNGRQEGRLPQKRSSLFTNLFSIPGQLADTILSGEFAV